jgi:hypothetical protein
MRFQFTQATVDWCVTALKANWQHFENVGGIGQSPQDEPVYNLMADALEWSDERPTDLLSSGTLKQLYSALLNARTTIILAEDQNEICKDLFRLAAQFIPKWNGLRPERRSQHLRGTFETLSQLSEIETKKCLDRL